MTVSNNNPDGWMTGVVALVVLIVTLMTAAILSSCVGFSHKAKSRFWGSVQAGHSLFELLVISLQHRS